MTLGKQTGCLHKPPHHRSNINQFALLCSRPNAYLKLEFCNEHLRNFTAVWVKISLLSLKTLYIIDTIASNGKNIAQCTMQQRCADCGWVRLQTGICRIFRICGETVTNADPNSW